MNIKERSKKLKSDISAVFLALKRTETPMIAKIFVVFTVVYALSPIDLIPDFIPVLGYLDDVILLPAFVALTIKFIPKNVFQQCQKESEGMWADAVDYALINICQNGDIVVSQDYGVAAMALGKGAYAIHQSGKWYTNDNIDQMLMERHLSKKARMGKGKHHVKGPAKRTEEDDKHFEESFLKLVEVAQSGK